MEGSSAKDPMAEFNTTKALRLDVAKPVWHNSLRLPKNEASTNSEWAIIADDYMSRMGFSETHLRCYVLHDDEDGQHIHIIASHIDLNGGKLYLGRNENLASKSTIQQLERDYNLTSTKGPEAKAQGSLKPSHCGNLTISFYRQYANPLQQLRMSGLRFAQFYLLFSPQKGRYHQIPTFWLHLASCGLYQERPLDTHPILKLSICPRNGIGVASILNHWD